MFDFAKDTLLKLFWLVDVACAYFCAEKYYMCAFVYVCGSNIKMLKNLTDVKVYGAASQMTSKYGASPGRTKERYTHHSAKTKTLKPSMSISDDISIINPWRHHNMWNALDGKGHFYVADKHPQKSIFNWSNELWISLSGNPIGLRVFFNLTNWAGAARIM